MLKITHNLRKSNPIESIRLDGLKFRQYIDEDIPDGDYLVYGPGLEYPAFHVYLNGMFRHTNELNFRAPNNSWWLAKLPTNIKLTE